MAGKTSARADGVVRFAAFGDELGVPRLCRHLTAGSIIAVVAAEIRPGSHGAVREAASATGAPFLIQPRRHSPLFGEFLDTVRALKPDFIIVHSYAMLLPPELLGTAARGAINVHGGLLPHYRGCNPIQWAILNNEKEAGVTLHHMTADFDAGDIIAQKEVPILFEDTWLDVQRRILAATDELLAEEIPKMLAGTSARIPQDEGKAKYHRRRTPEDGLIDWSRDALSIYNQIRALTAPHPGAFYLDENGKKIVLDRLLPLEEVVRMKNMFSGDRRG
jgi:methionyl-tRNA formyltransferase